MAAATSRVVDQMVDALIDTHARGYAGDVLPTVAYDFLKHQHGWLVDVRTRPEWQFTGAPDLRATPNQALFISWKDYPHFQLNLDFIPALKTHIPSTNTLIFFLCRSGGRSLDAAIAMTAQGYPYCFNIAGGFEGEPDANGNRCSREGWKALGLPWSQT